MVIGGAVSAWLSSSQIAVPGELTDVAEEPLDGELRAEAVVPESFASPHAGHRLRRRGWLLRRALLVADAAAFVAAL
ncbi:MAG TPA: hypothetical protein VH297_09515, partial [Gaiellaceae bacterium]